MMKIFMPRFTKLGVKKENKMNPTLKAIISLDEIIMSDYILDYIDSYVEVSHITNSVQQ